ncbi:type II toxin-antitoxin system Phd/YefM family antitoxin [Streptomyces endophyticus]|uniref:Antitoxin n=1 Tax=Streptomyces endophyticus TaxID=714166 RepID=A0ABU6FKD9_9ACTN|nr:type II toxin-antitoxin system prevent-host-death family antitoxin [Streptomyces endophyticus]MEB8344072.1 type II toxin-antitoxin system prevent-host-death family antitoxin [Streptomyces endophyticus]
MNLRSSELLDRVERGEEVTVTRNGRAVARMVPVDHTDGPPHPTSSTGAVDLPEIGLAEPATNTDTDGIV